MFGTSRFVYVGVAALAVGIVHCGGGLPAPNGGSQSGGNSSGSAGGGNTDQLISDLLGGMESGSGSSQPPPSGPAPTIAPAPAPASGGNRLDTFDEDVQRVQSIVPGWDSGTGVVVRFLKEATNTRLSLIYVDASAPQYKDGVGLHMIQAKATADGKTLGWFVILLQRLEPGLYRGDPNDKSVVTAALMAENWDGKNPEATWSINNGSWAEINLKPGRNPGDLEGVFRAKMYDNKGTGYHTVESGYVYINR